MPPAGQPGGIHIVLGVDAAGLDLYLARLVASAPFAHIRRDSRLNPHVDIAENIFLGIEPRTRFFGGSGFVDRTRLRAAAHALLARLGVALPPVTPARELKAADRVLVEVARALARDSPLIALQEPTALLNDDDARRITAVLRVLAAEGEHLVIASQRPMWALGIGDRISVLHDGAITASRTREEWGDDDEARAELLSLMAPPSRPAGVQATAVRAGEDAFRIERWNVHHELDPARDVVVDATITVSSGEVVGLAGLEGSGRNELLLSVYGRMTGASAAGSVSLAGIPIDTSTVSRAIQAGVFLVATELPRYRVTMVGGVSAPVPAPLLPALAAAGLVSRAEKPATPSPGSRAFDALRSHGQESGWEHTRGILSLFPSSGHRVLLLVEPTHGLGDAERAEFRRLVASTAAAGVCVVMSSNDLEELYAVSDRIVAMSSGRIAGVMPVRSRPTALLSLIAPG